jgi:CRP/FNR family transcriptional regulator
MASILSNPFMALSQLPVFDRLCTMEAAEVVQQVTVQTYARNCYVYQAGDPTDRVYLLLKGIIKTGILLPDSKEIVRNLVKPGDFFGFGGILDQKNHSEFAKSLNVDIQVLSIPTTDFLGIMWRSSAFAQGVIQMVGKALASSEARLEMLLTSDVRTRIAYFLKENAQTDSNQEGIETLLRFGLTQQDIAHMIGATRQTVALVLNELRKENRIDFSRKKFVLKNVQGFDDLSLQSNPRPGAL